MSSEESRLRSAQRERIEARGWQTVSWAADAYDTLQYSFQRVIPEGIVLVVVNFTEAASRTSHLRVERWTYADETDRALLIDRFLDAATTPEAVEMHVEDVLDRWEAQSIPDPFESDVGDNREEDAPLGSLDLANHPDFAIAELRRAEVLQEGMAQLEHLGAELSATLRLSHEPAQPVGGLLGRLFPRRDGVDISDRLDTLFVLLAPLAVAFFWAVLLTDWFAAIFRYYSAAVASGALVAGFSVLGLTYVGSTWARRRYSTSKRLTSQLLLPSVVLAAVAALMALAWVWRGGVNSFTGLSAGFNGLIALGVTIGSHLYFSSVWSRVNAGALEKRRSRVFLLREYLARANELRAANVRAQLGALDVQHDAAVAALFARNRSNYLASRPYADWVDEVERELQAETALDFDGARLDRSARSIWTL